MFESLSCHFWWMSQVKRSFLTHMYICLDGHVWIVKVSFLMNVSGETPFLTHPVAFLDEPCFFSEMSFLMNVLSETLILLPLRTSHWPPPRIPHSWLSGVSMTTLAQADGWVAVCVAFLHPVFLRSCVPAFLRSCGADGASTLQYSSYLGLPGFNDLHFCCYLQYLGTPLTPTTFNFVVICSILGPPDSTDLHFCCYLQHFGCSWPQPPSFSILFTAFWDPLTSTTFIFNVFYSILGPLTLMTFIFSSIIACCDPMQYNTGTVHYSIIQ